MLRQAQRKVTVREIREKYLALSQIRAPLVCSYGYSSLKKRNCYLVFSKRRWIPTDWLRSVGAHHLLQSCLRYLKLVTNLQDMFEILALAQGCTEHEWQNKDLMLRPEVPVLYDTARFPPEKKIHSTTSNPDGFSRQIPPHRITDLADWEGCGKLMRSVYLAPASGTSRWRQHIF